MKWCSFTNQSHLFSSLLKNCFAQYLQEEVILGKHKFNNSSYPTPVLSEQGNSTLNKTLQCE